MSHSERRLPACLWGSEVPLAEAFDAALFDLDGVVYRGPLAVDHAPEAIARARDAGMATVFVTNNANREPGTVAEHLTGIGVPSTPSDVLTSSQVAAALLAAELAPGARVLAVGGPGLTTALRDAGFTLVGSAEDAPDAVVQGFAPGVGWTQLTEAAYAVRGGARFVATNLDLTIPTERGIAPGNGALVAVVRAASGVEPLSAGKPQPAMFLQAASRAGAERPLVVGDRLDTDLAGAVAAGQAGLLVLTGVSDARDLVLAEPGERPRFVALDLRGLLVAHPGPEPDPSGAWVCRGATARVLPDAGGVLIVEADGTQVTVPASSAGAGEVVEISLDALRALCCAAWQAADAGAPLRDLPAVRVRAEHVGVAG